jgi:FkbM family methyltransferase
VAQNDRIAGVTSNGVVYKFEVVNETDYIQRHHRSGGFYEIDVLQRLRLVIPHQSIILDIGANVGNHTVYFAGVLGALRVYPFEPNPILNAALRRNIELNNLSNVDISFCSFALGRSAMQARLVVTRPDNWGNGHFALPKEDGGPSDVAFEAIVEVRSLDSFGFEKVDFIKIDVEGHESEVIKGAVDTIRRNKPVLFVEVGVSRSPFVVGTLKDMGYEVIDYFCSYRGQRNYLLVPVS